MQAVINYNDKCFRFTVVLSCSLQVSSNIIAGQCRDNTYSKIVISDATFAVDIACSAQKGPNNPKQNVSSHYEYSVQSESI